MSEDSDYFAMYRIRDKIRIVVAHRKYLEKIRRKLTSVQQQRSLEHLRKNKSKTKKIKKKKN